MVISPVTEGNEHVIGHRPVDVGRSDRQSANGEPTMNDKQFKKMMKTLARMWKNKSSEEKKAYIAQWLKNAKSKS